jgi:succinate-semialdehyde dehydrogenase/glutarate-semialdehyde dehydrogenase
MQSDECLANAAELFPRGLPPTGNLIGGRRLTGGEEFSVHDRYLQVKIAAVASVTREQVAQAVVTARAAVAHAPAPYDRARILRRVAETIDRRRQTFVDLMVAEVGFTPVDAESELERALDTVQLCAEEAKRITGDMIALDGNPGQHHRLGFTLRTPVGVVCAITPFNAPLNAVLHKVAPALAAGNAVILKPSAYTPLTASLVCEALLEAGLPPDLLALVQGGAEVGSWLLEEQGIDFYTFTGSTRVGKLIQAGAGLRRTQLELGSIACTIVCADADLDQAIPRIARASFRKAGQVCTSIQRLYVVRSIEQEVNRRLIAAAAEMPAGDPRDPAFRIGPMISEGEAKRAQSWLDEAAGAQARIECGGSRAGAVLQPTVLSHVRPGLKVIEEEIFAPVVSLLPFDRLSEAIDAINATRFGLAAGIFTRNLDEALLAARAINSGAVHINETSSSRVDGMPYGGVKESGFGREGPRYAIREMTDEKVITIAPGRSA